MVIFYLLLLSVISICFIHLVCHPRSTQIYLGTGQDYSILHWRSQLSFASSVLPVSQGHHHITSYLRFIVIVVSVLCNPVTDKHSTGRVAPERFANSPPETLSQPRRHHPFSDTSTRHRITIILNVVLPQRMVLLFRTITHHRAQSNWTHPSRLHSKPRLPQNYLQKYFEEK